jgi:hypothetical protein
MNGMHQEQHWAFTTGSDDFSSTHHFELPPTPTLAQIHLADYFEFDDQSHADIGFISGTFVDGDGVTRDLTFPDIDQFDATHAFAQSGLASATFGIRVSNCAGSYIVNFFFWDSVN